MKKHCDFHVDQEEKDHISNNEFHIHKGREEHNETSNVSSKPICHTMTMKECETTYRPQMTKVKVRVCPNDINLDKESDEKMQNR